MYDQLLEIFFSYLSSLLYAGVSIIGIVAGLMLRGKTRNKGPLLILLGSSLNFLVGLLFPLSNFLQYKLSLEYSVLNHFWVTLNLADISSTSLLLVGLLLVAIDFRAFLTQDQIRNQTEE